MRTITDFAQLLTDLDSFIDDSYEKWLNNKSIEHDENHDNQINEDDYACYLEGHL